MSEHADTSQKDSSMCWIGLVSGTVGGQSSTPIDSEPAAPSYGITSTSLRSGRFALDAHAVMITLLAIAAALLEQYPISLTHTGSS